MNRADYLAALEMKLKKLPPEEIKSAMDYYTEYFDDAGVENEAAVMDELGSPSGVASQIMANFVIKESETPTKSTKKSFGWIWTVILALFAAPIALPLALAAVIIIFAIVVSVGAVLFSLAVSGIVIFAAGVVYTVVAVTLLPSGVLTALYFFGSGMALTGLGFLLTEGMIIVGAKFFAWLARRISKSLVKKNNRSA